MAEAPNESLIDAVREGNLQRVDELLASAGLANALSWSDGYALLREAIDNDQTEIAKLLIMNINTEIDSNRLSLTMKGRDALSNIVNIVQFTILELTVINGGLEILQLLLDKGEDSRDLYVKPLLHVAVRHNKMPVVEMLMGLGADPNFRADGLTPLHVAVTENCLDIAKYLLINGAHVDSACAVGPNCCTPLHFAIERGNPTLVKWLLVHGASIESRNRNYKTALKLALHKGHSVITAYIYMCSLEMKDYDRREALRAVDRHENDYRLIFQRFARTYNFDNFINKKTMLPVLVHAAVQTGSIPIVRYFMELGFEINSPTAHSPQSRERQTLLHSAVRSVQEEMAAFLIINGADPNAIDSEHRTPIFYAVEYVDVDMARLLVNNGAQIQNNPYLLRSAAMNASRELVDLIFENDPYIDVNAKDNYNNTALHSASIGSANENFGNKIRADIARLLLSKGADVNARGYKDARPLNFAVQAGRVEVVAVLLAFNADVNIAAASDSNTTPLHECTRYATGVASVEIAKMLLARNVNVDAKTSGGATALYFASERGNTEVVKLLLKHGAEVDIKTPDGMTALHAASIRGFAETIAVLLKYGADINTLCNNGKTPPDYVISRFINNRTYCSRRCRCKRLVKVFKHHIIKMILTNQHIIKQNLEMLSRGQLNTDGFEESCKEEILKMKLEKVSGNASFYDVLTKNVHEVSIYAKYEKVVETLEKQDWREKFPIYCHMIWNKYKKARNREVLLDPSVSSFNCLIGQDFLDVLTMDIFKHLSDEDLGNLIKASQISDNERVSYVGNTIKKLRNFFTDAKNFAMKSNKAPN